jgi:hypothetical protein
LPGVCVAVGGLTSTHRLSVPTIGAGEHLQGLARSIAIGAFRPLQQQGQVFDHCRIAQHAEAARRFGPDPDTRIAQGRPQWFPGRDSSMLTQSLSCDEAHDFNRIFGQRTGDGTLGLLRPQSVKGHDRLLAH